MSIDFEDELNKFFLAPPDTGAGPGNIRSVLYLLRRDLRDLTVPESTVLNDKTEAKAPVLASAGIMIGFELLARVWTGENDPNQDQMKAAFKDILNIDAHTADLMVRFRNAVAHGYQLEIFARNGTKYRFALGDQVGWTLWFEERKNGAEVEYHLNFWELRRRFLASITRVESALRDSAQTERQQNFYKMLPYLKPYLMVTSPEPAKTVK